MCTLALGFRLSDEVPLVVAANRDENYDRPSADPYVDGNNPKFLAGRDLRAEGTWLGVNEDGLMAAILNRRATGERGTGERARSRGLLCLDLLACGSAAAAADFLASHKLKYQPFTVVLADRGDAVSAHNQNGRIQSSRLAAGLHVFTSASEDESDSPKARHLHRRFAEGFKNYSPGGKGRAAWIQTLKDILADHIRPGASKDPGDAVCVHRDRSGTVSSSIVALDGQSGRFEMFHCPGPPCRTDFARPLYLGVR